MPEVTQWPEVGQDPAQLQTDPLIGPVPTLGDGQVDFEEFVTLLGPKLSTSGIPERFHGTDFDTVFWKVCHGLWDPRAVTLWRDILGPVNGQAQSVERG